MCVTGTSCTSADVATATTSNAEIVSSPEVSIRRAHGNRASRLWEDPLKIP